ncbi:MAG: hypothetical protein V5A43_11910 [Haloarculaceae archaeon]
MRLNQVEVEPGEVAAPHTNEGQEEVFVGPGTDGQIAIDGEVHTVPAGGIGYVHPDTVRNPAQPDRRRDPRLARHRGTPGRDRRGLGGRRDVRGRDWECGHREAISWGSGEARSDEPGSEETVNDETLSDEPGSEETVNDETVNDEPGSEETVNDETLSDEPGSEDTGTAHGENAS